MKNNTTSSSSTATQISQTKYDSGSPLDGASCSASSLEWGEVDIKNKPLKSMAVKIHCIAEDFPQMSINLYVPVAYPSGFDIQKVKYLMCSLEMVEGEDTHSTIREVLLDYGRERSLDTHLFPGESIFVQEVGHTSYPYRNKTNQLPPEHLD
jgi:hypothetical protein